MHKKDVLDVGQRRLNTMEQLLHTNRDSAVWNVSEPLSGKGAPLALHAFSIGLDYGLPRIALSGNSANSQVIVHPNLTVSRITGLNALRGKSLNTVRFAIWSMMRPTFTRMAVC